ncbi:MucR family transcriptional regulator [Methylobacterium sp. SI9]|uniref:MucR family transcriptional regulator n=1 Tax=Methylobacterium guangdongense TaxID=3138811 RepID=UPI00313EF4B1
MNTIDLYEKSSDLNTDLIKCTASLVAAYVSRNAVGVGELPVLIDQVHTAITVLQNGTSGAGWTGPSAAQIEASIQHDGLISFIDGRPYKTLKRHLTAHGLTPERYRAKYGLPADYPMVAPGYAAKRSEIAKAIQLGHKAA